MNAIILAIGDELTSGQTVDSNSAWLSRHLHARGIIVLEHLTIGDRQGAIVQTLRWSAAQADLVLVTGGLGPTADDLTRQAMAEAMGVELVLDADCLADIEDFFQRRQRPMREANRIQAMIPAGAAAIRNGVGTAPGIDAPLGASRVFVMPGVPREMQWMFEQYVAPALPPGQGAILHRILHTYGAGESDVGTLIADLMLREGPLRVGTTASAGQVGVRIFSQASSQDEASRQAEAAAREIRRRLGTLVFGQDDETLATVVGGMLRERGQMLATAESCTGGMIGELVTAVAGSSGWYAGGVVCYANRLKEQLLDVPAEAIEQHGAVSETVAMAMAEGCRRLGTDWAISVTGIAGPTGGTQEKPVGLVWIGLAGPGGGQTHRHLMPGDRDLVRHRAAMAALNHLRLALQGE